MEQCSHVIQRHWWYYVTSRKRETNALRFVRRHGSQVHPGKKRFGHKKERKEKSSGWPSGPFRSLKPGSEPRNAPKSHCLYVRGLQCTMCTLFSIFFRATEQAQTYLKIWVWHPIKHVFVPACSSVRKVHLFTFLWFWNSRYVISPKICPCILPFFPKYAPSSSSSSLGHSRPSASLSTTNIVDLLSTIIVLF